MKNSHTVTDRIGKCRYVIHISAGSSFIAMRGLGQKAQATYRHFFKLQEGGKYDGLPDQRDNVNIAAIIKKLEQSIVNIARMMESFGASAASGIPPVSDRKPMASGPRTTKNKKNVLAEMMKKV